MIEGGTLECIAGDFQPPVRDCREPGLFSMRAIQNPEIRVRIIP